MARNNLHRIDLILDRVVTDNLHGITVFTTPTHVHRVTRVLSGGKPMKGTRREFVVTLGKPNHRERAYLKRQVKYGTEGGYPVTMTTPIPVPRSKGTGKRARRP